MKRSILFQLIGAFVLLLAYTSCSYEDYADADYPATKVYQPMALEKIWNINEETVENPTVTPGEPKRYILDKANNKFIVLLGVVQGGIELKSGTVDTYIDHSTVNTMIVNGTLPIGTLPLPESSYSLPASVKIEANATYVTYQMEIDLNALIGANAGKRFAVAVKISSSTFSVNKELDTAVICIDTTFIQNLL